MKAISGRAFARLLERRGWKLLRISGSHHIYGREGEIARISVPVHGNSALKVGLLRHIAKLANIPEDELR